MALNLPAPASLDECLGPDRGSAGSVWDNWLSRFENYLLAIAITDDKQKRAILLHMCGPITQDEFKTIPETGDTYDTAIQKLKDHFKPQINQEYEKAKFRTMRQQPSEQLGAYHTRLRQQALSCSFGGLLDSEIKSHIIQTTTDGKLRKKGLREEMTLSAVLKEGRNNELSSAQNREMEETLGARSEDKSVNKLQPHPGKLYSKWQRPQQSNRPPSNQKCRNCATGTFPHVGGREKCPAFGKQCYKCGRDNHFASACRSPHETSTPTPRTSQYREGYKRKAVNATVQSEDKTDAQYYETTSDDEYPFSITDICPDPISGQLVNHISKLPKFRVSVHDIDIAMMADSGATCSTIDELTYNNKLKDIKLDTANTRLNPYGGGIAIRPIGKFKCTVKCNETKKQCTEVFYVVPGQCVGLLSCQTSQKLGLIKIAKHVMSVDNVNQASGQSDNQKAGSTQKGNKHNVNQASGQSDNQKAGSTHMIYPVADQFISKHPELVQGIGKMGDFEVKLHIDQNVQPVAQRHRRIPFHLRKKVEAEIRKLEELDIIERVDGPTPWVSPIVAAPKPKAPDEIRLCVDMRMANKAIIRERHPTPTIDDLISKLNGATVFSKIDLRSGYHQLPLAEESRYITTFSTHLGLRRYKRLNFGISSASEIFQNVVGSVIGGVEGALNISDDIIITGQNQAEHDQSVTEVLEKLAKSGLTINLPKCSFSQNKLEFFGMVFSAEGMEIANSKVKAIVGMTSPTNHSEVLSLLGMTNYCARFIENYSDITAPIRELTRKQTKFIWGEDQEKAFDRLKTAIKSDNALAYFDARKETEIIVDASPIGLGAILVQHGENGKNIVAYGSRALTHVEQRYAQIEREALACVWSCEHFHQYVFGAPVTITTDHKPLLSMFGNPNAKLPMRIERWMLRLLPYQPKIQFKRGVDNPADYLSRHPQQLTKPSSREEQIAEEYINFVAEMAIPKALTREQIREKTDKDPTLCAVRDLVQSNKWHMMADMYMQNPNIDHATLKTYSKQSSELGMTSDGLVLRGTRICVPASLQVHTVKLAHEGHQGLNKTKRLLREKVYFPGIDDMVTSLIYQCVPCMSNTDEKPREPLIMTNLPERPWSNLASDFYGPLPSGHYLMVVIDEYSRFPEVEILKSLSASTVIPLMDKMFASRGNPDKLKTDNGTPFQSAEFREFAEQLGFKHQKVTPYWPEANGCAEGFMKNIGKLVKCSQIEGRDWRRELYRFLRNYRATPHTTTGLPPATVLNGYPLKMKLPEIIQHQEKTNIRQKDKQAKMKMKRYAERRRNIRRSDIKSGDKVIMKNMKMGGKLQAKFQPQPFTVVRRKGPMIVAQRGQEIKVRNSQHFKRVETTEDPLQTREWLHEEERLPFPEHVIPQPPPISNTPAPRLPAPQHKQHAPIPISPPSTPVALSNSPVTIQRPKRQVQAPSYLKDYIT